MKSFGFQAACYLWPDEAALFPKNSLFHDICRGSEFHTRAPNILKEEEEEEQGKDVTDVLSPWGPLKRLEPRRLKDMVIQG